jgi:hypothetical protein
MVAAVGLRHVYSTRVTVTGGRGAVGVASASTAAAEAAAAAGTAVCCEVGVCGMCMAPNGSFSLQGGTEQLVGLMHVVQAVAGCKFGLYGGMWYGARHPSVSEQASHR